MQITIGNAEQIAAMLEMVVDVIRRLKENGTLDEFCGDVSRLIKETHAITIACDVTAYNFYRQAGMSSEEAVHVLVSRMKSKEDAAELLKKALRSHLQ